VTGDRGRAAMVQYAALRAVDTLKVLFAPFLPFSSQKLHELLGHRGILAGSPEIREVAEPGEAPHRVLTGDYAAWTAHWEPGELPAGQILLPPAPLFQKLAAAVVEEELARLRPPAAGGARGSAD
jgi:methionyl-tRNA synthetase